MLAPSRNQVINIHTHHLPVSDEVFAINNVYAQDIQGGFFSNKSAFSIGFHPWHILYTKIEEGIANVDAMASKPTVLAIGEAGLDRNIDTSFELQKEVFTQQITISERIEKPMLIHSGEAFDELLMIRKETDAIESWIFHGFEGDLDMARQIIHAECYLSFGEDLLKPETRASKLFPYIDEDMFFLESDNTTQYNIFDVYKKAAMLRGMTVEQLRARIYSNFRKCFFNEEKG